MYTSFNAIERRFHCLIMTNAFKGVIKSSANHLCDSSLKSFPIQIVGIYEFSAPEFLSDFELFWVYVDTDDSFGARDFASHNCRKTNGSKTPHATS